MAGALPNSWLKRASLSSGRAGTRTPYTEHLWREVKRLGIRVALVEPGSINTKLTSNQREAVERLGDYEPWRRRALEALRRLEEKAPGPRRLGR